VRPFTDPALIAAIVLVALALAAKALVHLLRFKRKRGDTVRCAILIGDGQFRCPVAGVSNYQPALATIVNDRIETMSTVRCVAILRREPNRLDAIRVEVDANCVGYLPRDLARKLSPRLAAGGYGAAACHARVVIGWRNARGQHAGNFGIALDAALPFQIARPQAPKIDGSQRGRPKSRAHNGSDARVAQIYLRSPQRESVASRVSKVR
jgi:hypothetical protein